MIGRFMLAFGPLNALADTTMFVFLLRVMHAGPAMFRAGFFAESFLTQTLIVFAIRTRRVPFFRSSPSISLAASTLAVTAIGLGLTFSPIAGFFGFAQLGWSFIPVLAVIVVVYTLLVEATKAGVLSPRNRDSNVNCGSARRWSALGAGEHWNRRSILTATARQ